MCNFLVYLLTVEGTCPDCGDHGYCNCYTDLECRCNYGFTGVNGSCEGNCIIYIFRSTMCTKNRAISISYFYTVFY